MGNYQKYHKRSQRGRGRSPKITEDHDLKGGGRRVCKDIGQIEGAKEGNDYFQDQLLMCGSKGIIFIDQY